jgi:FkbM family methyltransferase
MPKRLRERSSDWLRLARGVSRLGADRSMRAKMLAVGLCAPLRDRLFRPVEARLRLRYGRLGELPWVVGPKSDFDVLSEVFVERVYAFGLPAAAPRVILDLGAHIGASVLFFHERFPDARIVALEPDPGTFERLRRNVGGLPGVELRHAAVAPQDGPVPFFPSRQGWVSSLTGDGDSVTVEGCTLAGLLRELGSVDLLKIDVEGAEREVLAGAALGEVGTIIGEYHGTPDPSDIERFFELLQRDFVLEPGSTFNFAGHNRNRS